MTDQRVSSEAVAVSVITGFLGSGKTTLLNRLLQHPDIEETAVLINEFGEIGLDHLLVDEIADDVLLLASGCICCTVRGELVDSLKGLYMRRLAGQVPPFKRVIIETTGLADPIPIVTCLMTDPLFKHSYRLESLVTTVDAVYGAGQLDDHVEAVRQAAVADRLIITKSDLAEDSGIDALRRRLTDLNPGATLMVVEHGDVSPDQLFDRALYDPKSKTSDVQGWLNQDAYDPHDQDHHHPVDVNRHDDHIASFCLAIDEPVDWPSFLEWYEDLANEQGDHLLRVKGIVNVAGEDAPFAIHCVQATRHTPQKLPGWPDDDRRSRIVFITHDLPRAAVEAAMRAAVKTVPAATGERPAGSATAPRTRRERWLNDAEIGRIFGALVEYPDSAAANAVRLMLLTGARSDEVLSATWDQIDLARGVWLVPARGHFHNQPRRVRLSPPARGLLGDLRDDAASDGVVFADPASGGRIADFETFWDGIMAAAEVGDAELAAVRPSLSRHMFEGLESDVVNRLLGIRETPAEVSA